MNLAKNILTTLLAFSLFGISSVLAAGVDHFEVKFEPENANIGESIDLTIQAVDKNNAVVTDYSGTILIFSESDPEAELPSELEENTYTFSAADEGLIKFENAVKFKSSGTQDIHIYDLNDDTVMGVAEAQIKKEEKEAKIDIEILSPEQGLTIGETNIKISGSTKKNHQIKIIVNGKDDITTTSNNEGLFEKTIDNLQNGENTFKAQVLNADSEVVGESETINIKVESNLPSLKNIKVNPTTVDPESSYEVEIISNKGLTEVSIVINDVLTKLNEVGEGIYRANLYSPKEAGDYAIDIVLKDEIGHEVKELGSASLTVNEVEHNAAVEPEPVVALVDEPSTGDDKKDLTITGIKLTKLKSKSVLVWDTIEGIEEYQIFKKLSGGDLELIDSTTHNKFEIAITGDEMKYDYFAIKAVAKTASGELYEGNLSEATKIQTGPELLILLILSLFIGGFMFITKQKRA